MSTLPQTAAELATTHFYEWEQLGRGWHIFELPVRLEPPFHPFISHSPKRPIQVPDDGLHLNLLNQVIRYFKNKKQKPAEEEEFVIEPYLFRNTERPVCFGITLAKEHKVRIQESEQLLVMLSQCEYPISFEIIGNNRNISIQIACHTSDARKVSGQIQAYFPEAILQEQKDKIDELLLTCPYISAIDYGLQQEFMRPIAMAESFDLDPFIGLFGAFDQLQEGTHAVIQVQFQSVLHPWAQSIIRSVTDGEGKPFFADAPDMVPLAKEKVAHPLFAATIKVLGTGGDSRKAESVVDVIGKSLVRIYIAPGNCLIPLLNDGYSIQEKADDIVLRQSHRLGMLLNTRELLTLVHLPSQAVTTSKLTRTIRKTKQAPEITKGHTLVLGINEHQGREQKVTVSSEQRRKHTHIIGATGTGKSTLLLSMIKQDIDTGNGVAVLDPHGDLIDSILSLIPEERIQDVVLIDPSDTEYSVGFNILSAHSDTEKEILASDLVAGFKRHSSSWGDQMNSVLANAILAFLESSKGGTLADLRRFLIEKPYRDTFLKTVQDPHIIYYWQKEFPLLRNNSIGSILTRLDTFLRPKPIRYMVVQKNTLDFEQLLDTKKILLIKLSQGLIGSENSYLLGTFFVTKLYQAAMARQAKEKEDRTDYFVYVDEFQNFLTPSMSLILSGARKYHMGLILAHQDMQQVTKHDTELASAIVSNAGTRICFRLGDSDAKRFAPGFSFFEAGDLEKLNTGEAIVRIERPDYDFSLSTLPVELPSTDVAQARRQAVTDYSRGRYGTTKAKIEKLLHEETELHPESTPKEEQVTPKPQPVQPVIPVLTEEAIEQTKQRLVVQKEETEHRYLQNLIKKMAESRGFTASIEHPTPDGEGRVDILLQGNSKTIACEVCVTTDVDWEMHNIQKCLDAGFNTVIECSNDKKTIENIKTKISSTFDTDIQKKILVYQPEELFAWLDEQIIKDVTPQTRIKGYRVKVAYEHVPENEMKRKKATISKAVLASLKSKK